MPLDPAAVKRANDRLWTQHPELGGRQLTMANSTTESAYRREWMKLYREELSDTPQPPPPVAIPQPVATPIPNCDETGMSEPCGGSESPEPDACGVADLFETSFEGQNYGYWCGGNHAPARGTVGDGTRVGPDLEGMIPDNEDEWANWIEEKCLPVPLNDVDHACMLHDLRIGLARKSNPNLDANSKDHRINQIHRQLLEDFQRESNDPSNDDFANQLPDNPNDNWFEKKAKRFRIRGTNFAAAGVVAFKYMVYKTTPDDEAAGGAADSGAGAATGSQVDSADGGASAAISGD